MKIYGLVPLNWYEIELNIYQTPFKFEGCLVIKVFKFALALVIYIIQAMTF